MRSAEITKPRRGPKSSIVSAARDPRQTPMVLVAGQRRSLGARRRTRRCTTPSSSKSSPRWRPSRATLDPQARPLAGLPRAQALRAQAREERLLWTIVTFAMQSEVNGNELRYGAVRHCWRPASCRLPPSPRNPKTPMPNTTRKSRKVAEQPVPPLRPAAAADANAAPVAKPKIGDTVHERIFPWRLRCQQPKGPHDVLPARPPGRAALQVQARQRV